MGCYPYSISKLRQIIKDTFPLATAKERKDLDQLLLDDSALMSHLLWMLERIEEMHDKPKKAARWLGYVVGRLEAKALLANVLARGIIRKDVLDGND